MNKLLFIGIVSSLLLGCSTEPITEKTGKQILPDRVYQPEYLKPEQGKGAITVLRDSGFTGSACSHDLFLDQVKVASLKQGEFVKLYAIPGEHIVRSTLGYGLCPNVEMTDTLNIKENSNVKYRLTTDSNMVIRLIRIQ